MSSGFETRQGSIQPAFNEKRIDICTDFIFLLQICVSCRYSNRYSHIICITIVAPVRSKVFFDFSLTVKAASHECVIRTSQP